MKKSALYLSIGLLFSASAMAQTTCFLAKENHQMITQEGKGCKIRYAPESTFKIALSVMGYDTGILEDDTHPQWPFKKEYDHFINVWKGPHNPHSWLRDSCVWYSQVLTQKLGMHRFKDYVVKFDYGNHDVSGDKGKDNGLTNAWLSSSLQISPLEEVTFLEKMLNRQLPVSSKAIAMTKKIMFILELPGGWKLYGKTGSGRLLDNNAQKTELQHGWFVGWIEKNGRVVIFANHIADDKKQDVFASFRARNDALIKLWYLIDELEK